MYWFAWTVVITAYVAVSLFAAYMTYREHQRNGQRSLVMHLGHSQLSSLPRLALGGGRHVRFCSLAAR
jgi:hypothetical protein